MVVIGIDNGVTGTIGVITPTETILIQTPVKTQQDYTKAKKNITRVKFKDVVEFLGQLVVKYQDERFMVLIERPMKNPGRFTASISAVRAMEALVNAVEFHNLPLDHIDSKEWQKALLPQGVKGDDLKVASKDIGCRLFPQHTELICKHKDADGILIAEYCRRKFGL